MACWLTDNSEFLARWTDNGVKMHAGPYAWEDETYELPYTLYKFYGDKALLKKRFPAMLELVEKRVEFDGMILPKNGISHQYNDWLSPCGVSPNTEFFGGCWYYHMLDRISEIAEIIGENGKAAELRDKAEAARCEFNRRHLNADKCDYDAANQCGIVLPLAFGIAPAECRQALADTLVKYIEKEDWHLTTGFVGTRYILDVLSDYGYAETAYRVFTNPDAPSWLGMLSTGATAITESWHGLDEPDRSISMSHFSLGAACEWLFETVGGIKIDESDLSAGKIVLRPVRLNEVGSFKVRYRSVYGEITAGWKRENGRPEFYYTVPEGFEVELHI